MQNQSIRKFLNGYIWYSVIFTLSLVSLFVMPMIGTEVGLSIELPNTFAGWTVWAVTNTTSAALNVLIFHSFIKQGKLNIKDEKEYVEANNLLLINNIAREEEPRSPKKYHRSLYRSKGTTLFLFTVLGTISFSSAIITFDIVKFISQFITILIGIVCGLLQMKAVEEYWVLEYPEFAKMVVQEKQKEEETCSLLTEQSSET